MPLSTKLAEILALIFAKTRDGDVVWEKTPNKNVFITSFSKFSVMTTSLPSLRLFNEEGDLVEELSISSQTTTEQDAMLRELFSLARRQTLGVEHVLDEVLAELKTGKKT